MISTEIAYGDLLVGSGKMRVGTSTTLSWTWRPMPIPVYPGAPQTAVQDLPDDTIVFTLPSRHCQSDLWWAPTAWELFGATTPGMEPYSGDLRLALQQEH